MNGLPKYVATTTLVEPEWNASFIEGDVAPAVARLKSGDDTLLINEVRSWSAISAAMG